MAASRDLGEFIRELRNNARISLRQLAAQAGVSNPYLSQIERGLRKPSAEVLQQIANALRVSTPLMYLRAGLLAEREGQGVPAAITADPDLTDRHKKTLIEIYEAFRREAGRASDEAAGGAVTVPVTVSPPDVSTGATRTAAPRKASKRVSRSGRAGSVARKTAGEAVRQAANEAGQKAAKQAAKQAARKAATGTADQPATRHEKEMS